MALTKSHHVFKMRIGAPNLRVKFYYNSIYRLLFLSLLTQESVVRFYTILSFFLYCE
jgi:hypothetical protein